MRVTRHAVRGYRFFYTARFNNSSKAANHFILISSFHEGSKLGNLDKSMLFHEE